MGRNDSVRLKNNMRVCLCIGNNIGMRRVCRYLHIMESQIIYQWHTSRAAQLAKIPLNCWHSQFHTMKQLTIIGPIANVYLHLFAYLRSIPHTCPQLQKVYLYAKPSDSFISAQYPNYYTRIDHRTMEANNRNDLRNVDWFILLSTLTFGL